MRLQTTVKNIFDPSVYAAVRRPLLQAETLPPWCYTSPEFYQREVERIFRPMWNLVGRVDMIPEYGSYFTTDVGGVPLIITRGRHGEIHALANSCRHRGTELLQGAGQCRAIVCPYHGWAFDPNGTLHSAAGMEKTEGFRKEDYGLFEAPVEIWGGFIFATLNDHPTPLLEQLGDFVEQFGSYDFDSMVCTRRKAYDVACNWKVYVENQREGYHVPMVHGKSLAPQIAVPIEARGDWSGSFMKADGSIPGVLKNETRHLPPIASLKGRAAQGTHFVLVYPSTFFGLTGDCAWWMECIPKGPQRTQVIVGACFPKTTVARSDFAELVQLYYKRWDTSHPEDNVICEQQQRGLASLMAVPGRLCERENGVNVINKWVLDRVLDT
jgi:phenylpropionate dioxygenase-like ring-hydroxylating dioxygenase large terminal subunit